MNRSFHLKQSYNPKSPALAADEPAIVKSLSWLTQLNTLAAKEQPSSDDIVVVFGNVQHKGYMDRTNNASTDGTVLDVSIEDGRRYRLMADGTLYIRTINGQALPKADYTIEVFSTGSDQAVPMAFTVKKEPAEGWTPLGNFFGTSFGGSRKYTDYQSTWLPTELEHLDSPTSFDILAGSKGSAQPNVVALSEYAHQTEGPECLYGDNSPEAVAYVWHTAIVNSVVTVRRQTGDVCPSLSLDTITASLRVPEGTRRVSCTFTYYGVPVFVYETPQGYFATYLYRSGTTETVDLPLDTVNAQAWPEKPESYAPEVAEDFSKIYLGVFSHE